MTLPKQDIGNDIRAVLKAAFPKTRFSVRKSHSGWWGAMWVVRWKLGPSDDAVRLLVDPQRGTDFVSYWRDDDEE